MLPTLSAGPRMPALRRLTPNVGTSLRETRTDPQAIESQLVVAQCALAHRVVFPEAVHETEVPGVPVSGPRLCADRWLLAEVGFKSRGSEGNNDATLQSGRFRLCAYHSLSAK